VIQSTEVVCSLEDKTSYLKAMQVKTQSMTEEI
jgi:hypothetical protein